MKRPALITLLREQVGDASASNCATIKKKADLAVNVSERLPAKWLPAPMIVGAFDQADLPELDEADAEDIEEDAEMAYPVIGGPGIIGPPFVHRRAPVRPRRGRAAHATPARPAPGRPAARRVG